MWASAVAAGGFAVALGASAVLLGQTLGCMQALGLEGETVARAPRDAGVDVTPIQEAEAGPKCAAGTKECNEGCVPIDDPQYGCAPTGCAPCSVPFAATIRCERGKCVHGTCKPGRANCDGNGENGCEADILDPRTCNNCDTACQVGQVCTPTPAGRNECANGCAPGLRNCGGSCVDVTTNAAHCGDCNRPCAGGLNGDPACAGGACRLDCRSGFADCNNDPTTCEALAVFYRDGDGDGYGVTGATQTACTRPNGHAPLAGDCHDGNKDVFPGQKAFFDRPYTTNSLQGSFDYDCSGREETNGFVAVWTGCGANCSGGGVAPVGSTQNPICGSTMSYVCNAVMNPSNVPLRPATGTAPSCTVGTVATPPVACH
jgi:hypothetical protein